PGHICCSRDTARVCRIDRLLRSRAPRHARRPHGPIAIRIAARTDRVPSVIHFHPASWVRRRGLYGGGGGLAAVDDAASDDGGHGGAAKGAAIEGRVARAAGRFTGAERPGVVERKEGEVGERAGGDARRGVSVLSKHTRR